MATSNTTTTSNFSRQIVFDNLFTTGEKKTNFALNSGVTECTIGTVKCSATLYEIVFANEMYSPSHLTVKFNLVPDGENLPSYQDIVKYFLKEKVSIQRGDNNTGAPKYETIDTNYYVHEVRPTYVNAGNNTKDTKVKKKVVLYLDIFSADKLLTLDKYSKSYVNKGLYGDIIEAEVKSLFTKENTGGISVLTRDFSSRLKYEEQSGSGATTEIKHPYLVQYNESFYDFLIRTANRTGEFLYYADGQLTLGVKAGEDAVVTKVENYNSLTVESRNNSVLSTTGISRNYSVNLKEEKHEKNSSGLRYTQPTSNDDYLVVYEKDNFDSYADEYKFGWRLVPAIFKSLFTTPTIGALIKAIVVDLAAIESGKAAWNSYKANSRYNESIFEKGKGGKSADGSKAVFTGTYRDAYKDNWYDNADADFYNKIDECEKKMESRTITLTLKGDDDTNYKVGQLIEVEGSRYVVTHVNYSEIFDGRNLRQEYVLKALPLLTVQVDASTHQATLLLTDEKESPTGQSILICCPTALPEEKRIRKAAAQTAWVVDSDDPKYLGRVRIRYAWDKDGVDSPWIRQTEPAAGKEGGVNFRLYEDDEVMIGYENDNIEQPYIIGALYHGVDDGVKNAVPVGRNKYIQNTHLIRNRSGHQMVISEKRNNTSFFIGVNPTLSLLTAPINMLRDAAEWEDPDGSELAGGIQFNDKYGLYNVSMSSDQRLISIASPMGNIKLSAFTGISISAPRGDISISGKNVSIKAANKLTIESGSNAKNTEFKKTWHDVGGVKGFGTAIGNAAAQGIVGGIVGGFENFVASAVDLSLLRHAVECFVPPVDGTLQIKSHRYLLLEAGKGTAHIPQDGFQDEHTVEKDLGSYNKYYGGSNKVVKMKIHIQKLAGMVTQTSREYYYLLKQVSESAKNYDKARKKTSVPIPGLPQIIEYPTVEVAYTRLKDHAREKKFRNTFLIDQDGGNDRIMNSANAFWNAIKELDRFVNSKHNGSGLPYLKEGELGIAFTKAYNKLKDIFKQINVPDEYAQVVPGMESILRNNIVRRNKSEVIFTYLTTFRDCKPVSILKESGERLTILTPMTKGDWIGFMNGLQFQTPSGETFLEKVFGETTDNFIKNTKKNVDFWSTYSENKNWGYDRAKYGRILFSDQDNNTYYVDSKEKTIESKPNPNIGDIRDLILELLEYPDNPPQNP